MGPFSVKNMQVTSAAFGDNLLGGLRRSASFVKDEKLIAKKRVIRSLNVSKTRVESFVFAPNSYHGMLHRIVQLCIRDDCHCAVILPY